MAIPVPPLDPFVRERTAHYDSDYLAADPEFGQAHVTVLGPWLRHPTPADLAGIDEIAATTSAFDYSLEQVGVFPNGIIHLLPEPAGPFSALTHRVWARFPDHPPYSGQFPDATPHLTLDAVAPDVDEARVREMLGELVPARCRADRVQLQWWQAGHCHVQHTWRLREEG
nr:2'-5' RNA ligase family protein [Ornithinimicrobium sp. F0845]